MNLVNSLGSNPTMEQILEARVIGAESFLHNLFADIEAHKRNDLTTLKTEATALISKVKTLL